MILPASRYQLSTAPDLFSSENTPELRLRLLRLLLHARLLDEALQALKRRGHIPFQMSAAGHEAVGAVAAAMRPGDWLHPHYRDRALAIGRGMSNDELLLEYFGKKSGASGGRQMPEHFNSPQHRVVSLSTPVATNFLQAVGMAASLKERGLPEIVVASTGDASSRQGEVFEALAQAAVEKLPVVFLFEDNGYGISTRTRGKTFWTMPQSLVNGGVSGKWFLGCPVEIVDGLDPLAVYEAARLAIERARRGDGSSCLVTYVERLHSHSSSDDQRVYRSAEELAAAQARDPVTRYVQRCIDEGLVTAEDVEELKSELNAEISAATERARAVPDPEPGSARNSAFAPLPEELPKSEQALPRPLKKDAGGLTLAQCINAVLEQELRANARVSVSGEDVEDPKGDVFGITRGLSSKFPGRVRNSPLAEATIVGMASGRALVGDSPVATMQFVDFLGPALNQLFNEVATMHWRSRGQWSSAMVILAPYGAYLPGLGPWHSQTNEAMFAHIPGLNVVIPSNAADAAGLLRFALRCKQPVLYLYPKTLLHGAEGTVEAPSPECHVPFGKARVVRPGSDVTIVTWGNGVALSLAAAEQAAREGIAAEVLDLRTIVPWDRDAVLKSVARTGRLLVVHEDAKTCGFGGEIIAEVTSHLFDTLKAAPARVTKTDDHNPSQFALELAILPSIAEVLTALREQKRTEQQRTEAKGLRTEKNSARATANVTQSSALSPQSSLESSALSPQSSIVAVTIPRQSPTDEDAVVVRFLVAPGDQISAGTPVVEMEANKGSFEVEAPCTGTVLEYCAKAGDRVRVESVPVLRLQQQRTEAKGLRTEESSARAALDVTQSSALSPQSSTIALPAAQIQVGALALKSQREIPTVSTECEADVTALVQHREALKETFQQKFGFRPTYTHAILWALVRTMMLPEHQRFRGKLNERADKLLIEPHVHIGFAAIGPNETLYSPAIRDADLLSFVELSRRVQALTEKVRAGNVAATDLQGATVTLTNIGAYEVTIGTPFVIPGQLAMLTAGSILERPRVVFVEGRPAIEARKVLQLKLVFDHRPLNGAHAAAFLLALKSGLETIDLAGLLG